MPNGILPPPAPPARFRAFGEAAVSRHAREEQDGCFLADFRAAQQVGAFLHGEAARFHVSDDAGLLLEFAAVRGDLAFHVAIDADVSGSDVTLDLGGFPDGDFSLVGDDFAFDFAVDVHVILETDGSLDFDAGGEEVGYVVCHCRQMVGDGCFRFRWS